MPLTVDQFIVYTAINRNVQTDLMIIRNGLLMALRVRANSFLFVYPLFSSEKSKRTKANLLYSKILAYISVKEVFSVTLTFSKIEAN